MKTDPQNLTDKSGFRYPELDALRGIASLMVVFFHFTMDRPQAQLGFKLGTTGVDLFFIISGFVIFMSIGKVKKSAEFIINRFCRLYPTYWTVVTFTFLLIIISGLKPDVTVASYLANMSMFQYYFDIPHLDGTYWTMIVEMVFYIFILLLFHVRILRLFDAICISLIGVSLALNLLWPDLLFSKVMIFWFPLFQFLPLFFAGTAFFGFTFPRKIT
ncbi:acyltransferase family protein [Flavobacterium sp. 3HN19-14]|uniref:acyltransferase family protein n=1 Tax=Flavobacterium sp. 3HN19-14 TaxID=3448133 RepID=UPI003EE1B709